MRIKWHENELLIKMIFTLFTSQCITQVLGDKMIPKLDSPRVSLYFISSVIKDHCKYSFVFWLIKAFGLGVGLGWSFGGMTYLAPNKGNRMFRRWSGETGTPGEHNQTQYINITFLLNITMLAQKLYTHGWRVKGKTWINVWRNINADTSIPVHCMVKLSN